MPFIYFDMGNVLLHFSHEQGCRQMAAVAGITAEEVYRVLFESDLLVGIESGRLDDKSFYAAFCEKTKTQPPPWELERAGSDIFSVNASILPLIHSLSASGIPLGILSNTSAAHWRFVKARFSMLDLFSIHAPSFELGLLKPSRQIYEKAAALAGVDPSDIFFVDDRLENVEGARQAGWEATLFTGTEDLADELVRRGLIKR